MTLTIYEVAVFVLLMGRNMFLEDINTGTWPSRYMESKI
jgi:hypothetical protein